DRVCARRPRRQSAWRFFRRRGWQACGSARSYQVYHSGSFLPLIPAQAVIQIYHTGTLGPRLRGPHDASVAGCPSRGRAEFMTSERSTGETYDNSRSCPPTGISGAVLFVGMTRSNRSPLPCHCPATGGVLVTFFTGWPVHFTGPTIDL